MIKVGIIGFGKMGQIRAQAVETIGQGEILSIYDANEIPNPPYPVAASAEAILSDPRIDAVFLCTPNFLNAPLTVSALQQGKHVFCEKPPAVSIQEMEEVLREEAKTNKKLMYGFNHRHHASIQHMKSLIDDGVYGRILWMRGRYGKSVDNTFFDSWRSKKEFAGHGILLDQGIHMLDLFQFLGGEFHDVHAFVSNLYWKLDGIEDNVFAILRNQETGVVASLHSTMTQWRHLFSLEVFLEAGYMVLNGLKTSSGTYGAEVLSIAKNRTSAPAAVWDDEECITFDINVSWNSEVEAFFQSIQQNLPVKVGNSLEAMNVLRLIMRIYENERHESKVLYDRLQ